MSSLHVDIPHFQMPKHSQMCGAACLKMLFMHYGRFADLQTIWKNVQKLNGKKSFPYCGTARMVQYARSANLFAACVQPTIPESFIDLCLQNDIGIIAQCRPYEGIDYTHFVLVVGHEGDCLQLNDPLYKRSEGKDKSFHLSSFLDCMKNRGPYDLDIPVSHTFIIVGKPDLKTSSYNGLTSHGSESFTLPTVLDNQISNVLNSQFDAWYNSFSAT